MQEAILKRIDLLAEKLGTTSELIMQVLGQGILNKSIAISIFCIVTITLLVFAIKHLLSKICENEDMKEDIKITLGIFVSIFTFLIIIAGTTFAMTVPKVFAPKYYALHEIFNLFK